jgi:hypothetical protein
MTLELGYSAPQLEIFFEAPQHSKFIIVTKGRRFGATKGAANACIEWMLEGKAILWGDTIHSNIDRYFQRYIEPELKKAKLPYKYNVQQKQLKVMDGWIDFRSADNPENWEGFGYDQIVLNEAGIILQNKYLWSNAVLPMLLDNPDSRLFAMGVPKGQYLKTGEEHPFWVLWKQVEIGNPKYWGKCYSSYDNPLLSKTDIQELEEEIALMSPEMVPQEIYGQFITKTGTNPFLHQFQTDLHVSEQAVYRPDYPVICSMDFNLNPMAMGFYHHWRDKEGEHLHCFDAVSIENASIPKAVDYIREKYGQNLGGMRFTGDAMGKRGDLSQRDNATYYIQLQRALKISNRSFVLPGNPTHLNSRVHCNNVLLKVNVKFHPVTAKKLIQDCQLVQCDATGQIMKSNRKIISQQADQIDQFRYLVNAFFKHHQIK